MGPRLRLFALVLLCAAHAAAGAAPPTGAAAPDALFEFQPALRPSKSVAPFLEAVAPGHDAFTDEKEAAELSARLRDLGQALRRDPRAAAAATAARLAPGAEGPL